MKNVTLHNGDKLLIVEVPEETKFFEFPPNPIKPYLLYHGNTDMNGEIFEKEIEFRDATILGTFSNGEIDFPVNKKWVEHRKEYGKILIFKDYENGKALDNEKQSFLSLLSSEIAKSGMTGKKFVILKTN